MSSNTLFFRKTLFAVLALAACLSGAAAQSYLAVNDLEAGALKASVSVEGFTLIATEAKGLTVEALDISRNAEDGEVFNARLKLNGSGSMEFRAVKFTAAAKGTLTVYLNSSSKTDARVLKLVDAAGTVVSEIAAPPDVEGGAGMATAEIPAAGEYFLFSAGSGINLYAVAVD